MSEKNFGAPDMSAGKSMPAAEKTAETVIAPEIPRENWETCILLQRHGRYDSRAPQDRNNITEEEKKTLGRLTEEGKVEAAKRDDDRIAALMENDPENTYFLVINSPTFWHDFEDLGQRAKETADIIAERIKVELKKRGIDENHLLNTAKKENGEDAFKGDDSSRPERRVGEALFFQVPQFAAFLRKEYGGQGPAFWENFNEDTHKELREDLGAEGPEDISDRMNLIMNVAARFARKFHYDNPGKKLVPWIVSHGDGLEPFVQRSLNAKEADFKAGYNDGVAIAIDKGGRGKTTINGKEFEVSFPKKGFPESVKEANIEK
jgi:hypothetical protein